MPIEIKGAKEHNLKIDSLIINDGLTVVTGVSGSGKSSLVYNTIYHEASRQFYDIFGLSSRSKFSPAHIDEITGLRPSIAIDQNVLNKNPNSTVASSSGLHPLFRILFSRFGIRNCHSCNASVHSFTKDEIIQLLSNKNTCSDSKLSILLVNSLQGSFKSLIKFLQDAFPSNALNIVHNNEKISISMTLNTNDNATTSELRDTLDTIEQLGYQQISINEKSYSWGPNCPNCGIWLMPIEPKLFHMKCSICNGKQCEACKFTGTHPQTLNITWKGLLFREFLGMSVQESYNLILSSEDDELSQRLKTEIIGRLKALLSVGLEYLGLDRSVTTLSRGESQRIRLALALINNLEDMLYILDEPTIGLHIKNVLDIIPEFRNLKGSVIFVEHDKIAAASADYAVDIGPEAGINGGRITFNGSSNDLFKSNTLTGKYFNNSVQVSIPKRAKLHKNFLIVEDCYLRTLRHFTVKIPLQNLTVVTGVSGAGKTTLAVDVLVSSFNEKKPVGCTSINYLNKKIILVDQSPIGRNPRSNPATYTKLSDLIRDEFSRRTNLSPSYFSFNSEDGACPSCKGMGAIEVKLTFLPSTWIECDVCQGKKFNEKVINSKIKLNDYYYSISDILNLSIIEAHNLLIKNNFFENNNQKIANGILRSLLDSGLGYLQLGQPSPSLSGGEAQRIKLAKYLSKSNVSNTIFVLDEPSTGLHPADISGLLLIFDRLLQQGATIIVIEHNVDIIRSADWIIDLGPDSGVDGGELLYCGNLNGFQSNKNSITSNMLIKEQYITPETIPKSPHLNHNTNVLRIKNANIHNLQNVSIEIPKNAITIITGVSGSGKSSLISDIIEIEARRRFLESLSMYERQGTHESSEVNASIEGLGVTFSINSRKERYYLRNTVGFNTGISQQLAIIFSQLGLQYCDQCQIMMIKENNRWICHNCSKILVIATPRHFSSRNYSSACLKCHGVGTISIPNPSKLIIKPDKPLCKGAMYSPGFFPKGYLCKEGNGGYYYLRALGYAYNFNPEVTPWNEMTKEAQNAFLYGSDIILEYESYGLKGSHHLTKQKNGGFYYGFVREWDVGGTYTDHIDCPDCKGGGLRNQYLNIKINDANYNQLQNFSLENLLKFTVKLESNVKENKILQISYKKVVDKLTFLREVGLGYLHLKRTMGTLSAGEAQRIKLASFLGSNIQGLTITLDEPTRGMHPHEVNALISVLKQLRDKQNTILVIEHDLEIIKSGDYLIELGPKSGSLGGKIINSGTIKEFCTTESPTSKWIAKTPKIKNIFRLNKKTKFLKLLGARENNLKGDTLQIPLNCLVGICGVSGSGKSTLIIDTLGRIIAPQKQTTSVAYEPIKPGKYETIENVPKKAIIIDQVKKGISNPLTYFDLEKKLIELYLDSDEFIQSNLDKNLFKEKCSNCKGEGILKEDMGFLPPIIRACDICSGTGHIPEAWDIKLHGLALPELYSKTIDEVIDIFKDEQAFITKLQVLKQLGLGYLALKQSSYSLSGGEVQRLKIAKELTKKKNNNTIILLDEPSLGLHMEDISQLLRVLRMIVDQGNSIIIIEHQPYILASCDWLIELGPVGGEKGGFIINAGPPEEFIIKETPTSKYIKEILL